MKTKANKKILYIGSLNGGNPRTCGQILKTQLLKNVLEEEGFDLNVIDLSFFKNNPIKQIININKGIKNCDVIFAVPGPRAAHFVLPYLKHRNKKANKKMIYCSIGAGYVSEFVTKRFKTFYQDFIEERNLPKPKKSDINTLKAFSYNLFETQLLREIHERYYGLNNCFMLENFRILKKPILDSRNWKESTFLKMIYCSRITKEKGIFDLLKIVIKFNEEQPYKIHLDIFGHLNSLSTDEKTLFHEFCKNNYIHYKGFLDNSLVIETMSSYHLFCLPTKFLGEGTPGAISESLIAGTPVITSSFFQSKYILRDGVDGIIFDISNFDSLYKNLLELSQNKELLFRLHKGAEESGKKFLYSYQRELLLKYILD